MNKPLYHMLYVALLGVPDKDEYSIALGFPNTPSQPPASLQIFAHKELISVAEA